MDVYQNVINNVPSNVTSFVSVNSVNKKVRNKMDLIICRHLY